MDKDKFTRQYDYKANSNLVLPSQTDKRPNDDESGEVQSLAGRLKGRMGDKIATKSKTKTKSETEHKSKKKRHSSLLKQELTEVNYSIANIDLLYQPKSDQTALIYSLIIKFIRKQLGFQHISIINGAADEIIATMKDPNLTEESRRLEAEKLLSPDQSLTDEDYNELSNLCKKINDWDSNQAIKEDTAEEESAGVGVVYAEDDEASSDGYLSEVRESDDEFDLDGMFEKPQVVDIMTPFAPLKDSKYQSLNLEEISKRQTSARPKIDFGDPVRKEGYQEYTILPKKRPSSRHEHLIKLEDLPENERKAFSDFKTLNLIQSKIYKKAITSDKSLLICAPTGAGKTNIAILTMLREILKHPKKDGSGFDTDKFKIIYIAPIKALVQEIVTNFTRRLGCPPYNLKVDELTGDHQLNQRQISRAQIIVCTPEKWDIVTRKSVDRLFTKVVSLVIFDEIHLLHNERGATLEALVARIKRHRFIEGHPIRIIGLSATLPNYRDVARFIAPDESEDDSTFYFDSSYRPIPLKQQYIAMADSKKAFKMINEIVYEKVMDRLTDGAQILIFVHSRPDTAKTAEFIKCKALDEQKLNLLVSSNSSIEKINDLDHNINPKLKELLQFGLGIHHAGLCKEDRSCVEDLFRSKYIKVLVSTATLAWGVNLPARTVIIKGTQVYRDGEWTELDSLDVTQMLGRAGRPGFDKEGEGIVITQQSQVNFYMSLINEQLPVESQLIGRLPEFINAECVVSNIESLEDAVSWLSETYLSSRMTSVMQKSGNTYGIAEDAREKDPKLSLHKHNLAYTAISILDERGLVVFDRNSGAITSTELGRIASHYNCSSRTVKMFYESIHEHTSDIELLRTFSLADEFKNIFVRRGEEMDLQSLINQVPFPIDDKRASPGANKVNALLQVYIFKLNIEGSDLICDMHFIRENAARLARAIYEIVLMKRFALVAELSLDLCRKIDKRMTVCNSPLRQFSEELDQDIISRLEKKNYHIDELKMLKADKISELLRCERRQGEKIYKLLKFLPRLKIEASVKPISKTTLKIDLDILTDFSWNEKYHGNSERFWLLIQDINQEMLLHYELIHVKDYKTTTTMYIPYLIPRHPFYFIRVFADNWFGCDQHLPIFMEKLTLPNESVLITQPLDLEPRSVRSLGNPFFEKAYEDKFQGAQFNQIQTQSFKQLYETDDDIILLASAGSGKTTCAELAILRNILKRGASSKSGYVAANAQAAQLIYNEWTKLFGVQFKVCLLTGNHRLDAPLVDDATIIIGDPKNWHIMTLARTKKYRKLISKFQLFIIDDIHLLHNDKNSVLEWLCAKIRILTKLNIEDPARIVVLGSPIASADCLKSWMSFERGTKEPVLLNYPPSIRPVKLELTIQKFHNYNYDMRLLTMYRPVYRLLTQHSQDKPALIFVADFAQAQEVCKTLYRYSQSEGLTFTHPSSKLHLRDNELEKFINQGLGYIYDGMNESDRHLVESLFMSGQILILVVTVNLCWSIESRSHITIIMDTQQFDGLDATDYELTDIMQMVGLTGRPLSDHECRCIIMCHSSKAEYYERSLHEPLPIESELPVNLISHVSYEIATNSLTELNNIYKPYLAHTFFYKRISINPNYYGIMHEDSESKSKVFGAFFNNLVNKVSLDLEKTEFITMEGAHENPTFTPGLLAKISLEYYINYETLVSYTKWLTTSSKTLDFRSLELIELISSNTLEFDSIPVRNGELPTLKSLQRRYRCYDDQIYSRSSKIKLLLLSQYQKSEGKAESVEGELISDRHFIINMAHKLIMAIVDIAWLKDSFSLAKTALQLAKKLAPDFNRSTSPSLDMETNLVKDDDQVKIEVKVNRANEPYSLEEFKNTTRLPISVYREEGWCFLLHGNPKSKNDLEKFSLFKRVKTPSMGLNEYKLDFTLPENVDAYKYDLYFMSDFYSTREDRKVPDIQITDSSS